jgi:hypothetical protein
MIRELSNAGGRVPSEVTIGHFRERSSSWQDDAAKNHDHRRHYREKQFFDETIRALSSSFETATDQRIFPEEK